MSELKYADLLRLNRELAAQLTSPRFEVALLSNITIAPLKEILEYELRSQGVNAEVAVGNYDNIVQDSAQLKSAKAVVVLWELVNVTTGFSYRAELLEEEAFTAWLEKLKNEIRLVLSHLRHMPLVIFNRFSSTLFEGGDLRPGKLELLSVELNRLLDSLAPENTLLANVDKVIAQVSAQRSLDLRLFYSSKALYSIEFLRAYAKFISPALLASEGRAKKALIFDGDNTLWKGIVGEDGAENVICSPDSTRGAPYAEVQGIALGLRKRGVLLGLCSKNNPEDVSQVFTGNPHMVLREQDFAIRKINWQDKVANLRAIARELNIGLDSLVFVDDSDFEIGLVNQQLPEVTTIHVPHAAHEYPELMRKVSAMFFSLSHTEEDRKKTLMYQQQAERASASEAFTDMDDYLRSLGLVIGIASNDREKISRIAQLTQKTNQFNLTTRRYTETEITAMMQNPDHEIISLNIADRFGEYGLTGLAIIHFEEGQSLANIDSFMLSCRILGRKIETAFLNWLVKYLLERGVVSLNAEYIQTSKNGQTTDLYKNAGFVRTGATGQTVHYCLELEKYQPFAADFITVQYSK